MAVSTVAITKVAIDVAGDKRGRIVIATILCTVVMIFIMPLIAYMGIVSNLENIEFDKSEVTQEIIANLSSEEKDKLIHIENTMNKIQEEFKNKDMAKSSKKAQAIYCCALYDIEPTDSDFVKHLADCFEQSTDNDSLISLLQSTFSINIDKNEFENLMRVISNTTIDLDIPYEKTNEGLVKWVEYAYENKWGYVWGSHGNVLTESELQRLISVFGDNVSEKEEYIRSHWLGRRTADCVGLIKGYGWYDNDSGTIKYGTNSMMDVTADGMYQSATEKGTIDTMPDIPGLAVWHKGHIGVYVGNGYVIHASNTYDGVVKTPITSSSWTHWLKIPYINYLEEIKNHKGE